MLEGKIIGIVGLIGDITERVRLEKQAENWAVHDDLTGLYNRNYLKIKGAEQLKGAIMPITIIMGDCNYLKRVNDAYGHEYGDLLLKRVGRVIRENLPPESVALRMGGDEFLIACSHFSGRRGRTADREAARGAGPPERRPPQAGCCLWIPHCDRRSL